MTKETYSNRAGNPSLPSEQIEQPLLAADCECLDFWNFFNPPKKALLPPIPPEAPPSLETIPPDPNRVRERSRERKVYFPQSDNFPATLKNLDEQQLNQQLTQLEEDILASKQVGFEPLNRLILVIRELKSRNLPLNHGLALLELATGQKKFEGLDVYPLVNPVLCELAPGYYAPESKPPIITPPYTGTKTDRENTTKNYHFPADTSILTIPPSPLSSPPFQGKMDGKTIEQDKTGHIVYSTAPDANDPRVVTARNLGIEDADKASNLASEIIKDHLSDLSAGQEVLVIGHIFPDTDCLASSIATANIARKHTNNPIQTVFDERQTGVQIKDILGLLRAKGEINLVSPEDFGKMLERGPRLILVDTHETQNSLLKNRLGLLHDKKPVLVVDHHVPRDPSVKGLIFANYPSLTLALANNFSNPLESATGLTGILTDLGLDLGTCVSSFGDALIQGSNADQTLLKDSSSEETIGNHPNLNKPLNFSLLVELHEKLQNSALDRENFKPDMLNDIYSNRALSALAQPENAPLLANLDKLLNSAHSSKEAQTLIKQYFDNSQQLLASARTVSRDFKVKPENSPNNEALNVTYIDDESSFFAFAMGLIALERYVLQGGKPGDAKVAMTPIGNTPNHGYKASVLFSGPSSVKISDDFAKALRSVDIDCGVSNPILGKDKVVRVGTAIPGDKLADFYSVASRFIGEDGKIRIVPK